MQLLLDKQNKTYCAGEYISGIIRLKGVKGRFHGPIIARLYGGVKYDIRKGKEAKFISLLNGFGKIAEEGRLYVILLIFRKEGSNDFKFKLSTPKGEQVAESYRGVNIDISYYMEVIVDEYRREELIYLQYPVILILS